jgi:hypothetical protein
MPNYREQIESLLGAMERDARESYARGWADAIAALQAKAPEIAQAIPAGDTKGNGAASDSKQPQRARGRPEKAISLVQGAIFAEPGLRGVDIVRVLESNGTPVSDRTVRSALRRLRGKAVWQRKHKWYPKPKERTDAENEIGEVLGTPPH